MLKKKLPAGEKGQESKGIYLVNKNAKTLLIVFLFAAVFLITPLVLAQNDIYSLQLQKMTVLPNVASAATNVGDLTTFGAETILPTASLGVVVARVINAALGLLGLVAVIILLYGGFLWMTSRGEVDKVQKAKKLLIQGLIGLIIIVMSFAIAQFIFWMLGINPWISGGGGGGGIGDGGGGGGALGAGIIRSHYPARNAKNIPRNTKIAITFKEGVCGLTTDTNKNGTNGDCVGTNCDLINLSKVKIRRKADVSGPYLDLVKGVTIDNKTFVFTPVNPLGNDQTPTDYIVELTKAITYGRSCLNTFVGYNWSFQVSTELDLTPPQIESVIPKAMLDPQTVPRNTVIQINFNEAIDPTTLAGKLAINGGGKTGALDLNSYNLMTVKAGSAENDYVAGEFYFSNQYRTVEFITNDPCGTNSCGNEVFCLPSSSDISVLVKAATTEPGKPTAVFPYNGLVDMCSNSFDGNENGTADGPRTAEAYSLNIKSVPAPDNNPASAGDHAGWVFTTNDLIDLIPPQIENRNPSEIYDSAVNPDADVTINFDKIILSNSLIQEISLTLQQLGDTIALPDLTLEQKSGYDFSVKNNLAGTKSTITINTYKGLNNLNFYNIVAESGIMDITQNCYLPCSDWENCLRDRNEADPPGQYIQGDIWTPGGYENCNLAQ